MSMRAAGWLSTMGLALLSTAAAAQKVTYDFDRATDFSRLATYAWIDGTRVPDELNHKRIVAAIDAQLAAKGLTRIESGGGPDVLVAYHASFDRNLEINAFSSEWGGGWRFGSNRTGSARVEEIVTGTLVVDLLDGKSKSIIWRGTASREIDVKANADRRDRNVNRAAEKLFKHYPPAAK